MTLGLSLFPPQPPPRRSEPWGLEVSGFGWSVPLLLGLLLLAANAYSWLLFHTLAELLTITVGIMAAVVAWHTWPFSRNSYLLCAAAGLFYSGVLDLAHTLHYEGLNALPNTSHNSAIAYWLAARTIQSITLLMAPLLLGRSLQRGWLFAALAGVTLGIMVAIESGYFPVMYQPGSGLTAAKDYGEYLVIALLLVALLLLWRRRRLLGGRLWRAAFISTLLALSAELVFALCNSPGDPLVVVGHELKFFAYWALFVGLVATTLHEPFRAMARSATTYDAVPDITIVVDTTGTIRQTNQAARTFARLPETECIGRHCHPLFHPPTLSLADCPVCHKLHQGSGDGGVELEFPGGLWHLISLAPIDGGDISRGVVHVSRDITARKRAEQALRESEQRFRTLVETSHDWIWEVDAEARYTYVSPRASEILGYSNQELVGKRPYDLMPETERERLRIQVEPLWLRHEPIVALENTNITRSGRVVVLETSGVPFFDESGRFRGYRGIDRDITERKRYQEALRLGEARLAEAQRVGHIGSWELDLNDYSATWSDENYRLLGYRPNEVPPDMRNFMARVHPDDRARISSALELARRGELLVFTIEHRVVLPEGDEHYIQERGRVTLDADGRPQRVVGASVDVTELRHAQEEVVRLNADLERRVTERTAELANANRELEAFAYSVSHDLRAPLRSIDGFTQLLLRKYPDRLDATGQDYLTRVRNATVRMGQLIDDLLQLSRVIRADFQRSSVNLSTIAHEVVKELAEAEGERRVSVQIAPDLRAQADPRLIRIVLDNLLGNAWKFTARTTDAKIEFGMERTTTEPVYFVRDNGAGFDMAYAQKLFGAFQRLHNETEFAGTGIGLATVQRIIHRHNGRIWAEAILNQGATFHFTLGNPTQ